MEYKQVGIPKTLSDRFDNMRRYYGYRTFSEFVVNLVREGVRTLEERHEEVINELKRKDEHA